MNFQILFEPDAVRDIEGKIDYYDNELVGLGKKFEKALNKLFTSLGKSPFYSLRYDRVHCLPMKKYPFMIHFTIDEIHQKVIVIAILHTSLDPKKWDR